MTIALLPVGEGTIVEPSRGNGIPSTGRFQRGFSNSNLGIPRLGNRLLCTCIVTVVGSLNSEFLGWTWNTHVGIPMLVSK